MTHPAHVPMKVLIACEFSGVVRRAFDRLGHNVWSCDILRAEDGSNRHITGDVREVLDWGWDLLVVAHPPCTRLCNSGVRWLIDPGRMKNPGPDFTPAERMAWAEMTFAGKKRLIWQKLDEGAALFSDLWNADVPRIAIENPVMHDHAKQRIVGYEPFAQSVQPWQYGDWETKRTCLWLKGLDPLVPTYTTMSQCAAALGLGPDAKPVDRVHKMSPGAQRNKERSRFFPGIAEAMAYQWGGQALTEYEIAA